MKNLDFYFDPISPYVYLAFTQIPGFLSGRKTELHCIPVLFAGLLNAHGQKGPAEIIAKRKYVMTDCVRLAQHLRVPFEGPPVHPFNPLLPLRMCTAVEDHQKRLALAFQITHACWALGKDITNAHVLKELADSLDLPGSELLEKAGSDPVKAALKANTESAVQRDVFGVPSFVVDGELFWGHDRMDLLKEHLMGKLKTDQEKVARTLARPRGADRKQGT